MTICPQPTTQRYSLQDDKECEAQLMAALKVETTACIDTLCGSIIAGGVAHGKDYSQEMPFVKARVIEKLFGPEPAPVMAIDRFNAAERVGGDNC